MQLDQCTSTIHQLILPKLPPISYLILPDPPNTSSNPVATTLPKPHSLFRLSNPPSLPFNYDAVFPLSGAAVPPRHLLGILMNLIQKNKWLRRSLYECFSVHLYRAG